MSEIPDIPVEFDSEEELRGHLKQLENHIDLLNEELTESEKDNLEVEQELEEIKGKVSQTCREFQPLRDSLESIHKQLERFEKEKLDQYEGGPSKEAKEEFFDAAGWHPDDN